MGNFWEHLALAGFIGALLHLFLANRIGLNVSGSLVFVVLAVTLFSGVFPDIDHRSAKIHRMTRSFISLAFGVGISWFLFDGLMMIFLSSLIGSFLVYLSFGMIPFKHRGRTHTVTFGVVVAGIIGGISLFLFGSFVPAIFSFVGHFSHLVLDRMIRV